MSQVNDELGLSSTATISLNDAAVRTLAGVGGSGTVISMSNLQGKSAVTISLAQLQGAGFYEYLLGSGYTALTFNTNGTWGANGSDSGSLGSGNWASPTTSGVGNSYWIRWTRTAVTFGGGGTATPSSGWNALSSNQTITVSNDGSSSVYDAVYTLEISTNSSGTNIVASSTGTLLYTFNEG